MALGGYCSPSPLTKYSPCGVKFTPCFARYTISTSNSYKGLCSFASEYMNSSEAK